MRARLHSAAMPSATLALVALLAFPAACSDLDTTVDPTGGLPDVAVADPSFERDVQPLFTKRCSIGGCHSLASRQSGLVLAPGASWSAIVNVRSRLMPDRFIVRPFRSDSSWLIDIVGPDAARRGGFSRMPLASSPLTPNQIQMLRNWIDRGARATP